MFKNRLVFNLKKPRQHFITFRARIALADNSKGILSTPTFKHSNFFDIMPHIPYYFNHKNPKKTLGFATLVCRYIFNCEYVELDKQSLNGDF